MLHAAYDRTPGMPSKAGGLVVDGPITHFEVRGERLLALGSHVTPGPTYNQAVQVALYNVADLT